MHGLIIQPEFLALILSGRKDWELRGRLTHIRGKIGLIESGSGLVVGRAILSDALGPLSLRTLRANSRHLGYKPKQVIKPYSKTFAWVLSDAKRLVRPVKYRHPQGAIIWVRLSSSVSRKVR
jgi:hypothetical protein